MHFSRSECYSIQIKNKQKSTYVRINPEWRDCDFEYPGWVKK